MTRFLRVAALLAALMLSLSAATVLANHGQPGREVPFGGEGTTADSYGDPSTCPPDAAWRFFSTGQNIFTHLGLVTAESRTARGSNLRRRGTSVRAP